MIYRVNGKVYDVPQNAVDTFTRFAGEFNAGIPASLQTDKGKAHTPAPLRSISFTYMLIEYAAENWKEYEKAK